MPEKVNDDRIQDLEERFATGERPTEDDYAAIFHAIQVAAQNHAHTPDGGPESDTGDAAPPGFLRVGLATEMENTPQVGMVYITTDTASFYICFFDGIWTLVHHET